MSKDFFEFLAEKMSEEEKHRMNYVAKYLAEKFGLSESEVSKAIDDALLNYIHEWIERRSKNERGA
jgi:hypothetical protein